MCQVVGRAGERRKREPGRSGIGRPSTRQVRSRARAGPGEAGAGGAGSDVAYRGISRADARVAEKAQRRCLPIRARYGKRTVHALSALSKRQAGKARLILFPLCLRRRATGERQPREALWVARGERGECCEANAST